MDATIFLPLAKEVWGAVKGFVASDLEEQLGALPPDVRAALDRISETAAQAVIAAALAEDLRAAADDPARAARVAAIRARIEELKGGGEN